MTSVALPVATSVVLPVATSPALRIATSAVAVGLSVMTIGDLMSCAEDWRIVITVLVVSEAR